MLRIIVAVFLLGPRGLDLPVGDEIKSADEVVARYADAVGGRDRLLARQSMRKTIVVSMPDGAEASVVQEFQRPGKFRVEMTAGQGATFFRVFDGKSGWSLSPLQAGIVQMEPDEARLLEHEADFDSPLIDYRSKGHRLELIGRETLDGRSTYHLELVRKGAADGDFDQYYLDAESFLPLKVIFNDTVYGRNTKREQVLSDYRSVDGVLIAHTIKEVQDGVTDWVYDYTASAVEFDVELDEDRFRLKAPDLTLPEQIRSPRPRIEDDPEARRKYATMIAALRQATTLSFHSAYSMDMGGAGSIHCTYQAWLKKANRYRMEAFKANGELSGVLIGDGAFSWTHWPNGRPMMSAEEDPIAFARTRSKVYMRKPSPLAMHSIGHDAALLGAGILMTILDLSTFHGYTDSLQPTIDAIGGSGTEEVDGEICDLVLVSFMDGQRSWELWIAQRDHLPRRMRETVRVHLDLVAEEKWTDVEVNGEIDDELFCWAPPEGWSEYRQPTVGSRHLEVGTLAPDFQLDLAREGQLSLSELRGDVVILVFWRSG